MRTTCGLLLALLAIPAVRAYLPAGPSPAAAGPERTTLLQQALANSAVDAERWAYTQTVVSRDRQGRVKDEITVRYDPSRPLAEQWTPLRINGREPSERQIRQQQREHVQRRKNRRALGELLDPARATVVAETAETVTYEVPLLKDDNLRLPPEKFLVTARVNKERQVFEKVAVRLRSSVRVGLIVKLKSGEADLDFASVDPQFAPPITALRAEGEGAVLFVKVGGAYAATRSDFKRVTPYSERFQVKLAPLKFLDY